MLDGGSNCDVISKKLAEELKLPMDNVDSTLLLSVEGGNYGPRQFTDFAISNLEGDVTLPISDALVSDFLTTDEEKPPTNKEIEGVEYLEGVKFDELENKDIGILISMRHAIRKNQPRTNQWPKGQNLVGLSPVARERIPKK